MVGATGSGKSTTLAAMINHRNENASDHIVTIEDPIEFLHTNKRSIVNQREVGLDTKSYARALRGVVRAAPDVILIGEIRDRESMEAAINLAGTGHLVLATMHANNCAESLDRIINMFPREQHPQIFLDLSQYLRAIMAQRLVMGSDNRRVAAVEVMLNTPHIGDADQEGRRRRRSRKRSASAATRASRASTRRCIDLYQAGPHRARGGAAARRLARQPRGQDQLRLVALVHGADSIGRAAGSLGEAGCALRPLLRRGLAPWVSVEPRSCEDASTSRESAVREVKMNARIIRVLAVALRPAVGESAGAAQ